MIILDKFNGSCNSIHDLSTKNCVPSKTKDINVKVFKILTQTNEAKTMIKRTSCDCKCKFNNKACNSVQKWNNNIFQWECKKLSKSKSYYSQNLRILDQLFCLTNLIILKV